MYRVTILEDPSADGTYNKLFEKRADHIYHHFEGIPGSDLLVLTGGVDVSPNLYGDTPHKSSYNDVQRDTRDMAGHNIALLMDIPIVGICRGAQLLNVMNGGPLVQDVCNHKMGIHKVTTKDGKTFLVKGDHHQMMVPHGDFVLEAWADGLSDYYEFGGALTKKADILTKPIKEKEPEVVFWPNTKSLAIQFHPEWVGDNDGVDYFNELLEKYILN